MKTPDTELSLRAGILSWAVAIVRLVLLFIGLACVGGPLYFLQSSPLLRTFAIFGCSIMFSLLAVPMTLRRFLYRATVRKTAGEVVLQERILRQRETRFDRRTMATRLLRYAEGDHPDSLEISDGAKTITFGHLLGPDRVQQLFDFLEDSNDPPK